MGQYASVLSFSFIVSWYSNKASFARSAASLASPYSFLPFRILANNRSVYILYHRLRSALVFNLSASLFLERIQVNFTICRSHSGYILSASSSSFVSCISSLPVITHTSVLYSILYSKLLILLPWSAMVSSNFSIRFSNLFCSSAVSYNFTDRAHFSLSITSIFVFRWSILAAS